MKKYAFLMIGMIFLPIAATIAQNSKSAASLKPKTVTTPAHSSNLTSPTIVKNATTEATTVKSPNVHAPAAIAFPQNESAEKVKWHEEHKETKE